MRNILFLTIISFFILGCTNETKNPKFGETPLNLENFNFKMDFKSFMDNESLFDYYSSDETNGLNIEVDEREYKPYKYNYDENTDSTFYYLKFDLRRNENNLKLANYKEITFKKLEFATNDNEDEIFFVEAVNEDMPINEIKSLITSINTDLKDSKFNFIENEDNKICNLTWITTKQVITIFFTNHICYTYNYGYEEEKSEANFDDILGKIETNGSGKVKMYILQPKYVGLIND